MHQPLVVKRTTKYLAWKCNAVFASTRIHFISFQGFYRDYRAVQGLRSFGHHETVRLFLAKFSFMVL